MFWATRRNYQGTSEVNHEYDVSNEHITDRSWSSLVTEYSAGMC
jgi:hypothetical protein